MNKRRELHLFVLTLNQMMKTCNKFLVSRWVPIRVMWLGRLGRLGRLGLCVCQTKNPMQRRVQQLVTNK